MSDTKKPGVAGAFGSALAGISYDPMTALDRAIWAWADHADLPHAPQVRNRVACAMFAALAILLENEAPEEMGWLGLKNREFAEKIREKMSAALPDAPPGSLGQLMMKIHEKDGMVALEYTADVVVALPVETARTMAQGLLTVAGEIDGRRHATFFLAVPPAHLEEDDPTRLGT